MFGIVWRDFCVWTFLTSLNFMTFSWLSKPTKGHEQVSNIAVRASPWCEWTWWKPGPVRLSVGFLLPSSPDQSGPGAGRRTQRFLLEELQWWPVCRWRVTAGGMWETTADRMLGRFSAVNVWVCVGGSGVGGQRWLTPQTETGLFQESLLWTGGPQLVSEGPQPAPASRC